MPTIAVLGASSNRNKFGNKYVRAYAHAGYQVFPINPTEKEIEGFPAFAKLADIPQPLDRISVYLPPPVTLDYLPEIEAAKAGEVWLNPGAYDTPVLEALPAAAGFHPPRLQHRGHRALARDVRRVG